ncbi:DUF362 domain-containing protein [Acidobacteriota bacterium]
MAVFFDEVQRYHSGLIRESILRGWKELGVDLGGKESVFIKINTVRPAKPSSCVVTHPAVVEALIRVLREMGLGRIVLGEGPAAGVSVEKAFQKSGFTRLARRLNVPLLDLHREARESVEWEYGRLELPKVLLESDLYINVAKMKTHFHTGITLSIKNQQGLLTPAAKKANHRENHLHRSLVSIARVIQPDLVVVDGIDSMEGEGPTQGRKKHTGVMAFGDNMFETDIACCHFMGQSPLEVEHLSHAITQGLFPSSPKVSGDAFSRLRTSFEMPSPKPKKVLNFYSWKNYNACAEDEHCFEEAIHLAMRQPRYWFTFFPKFMYLVLFKRFHLLRGKKATVPDMPGHVLCIGNCSRDTAEHCGAHFVPGCPPEPEDILKTVIRMKKRP